MSPSPTISLCMIARDEEEHLPRCLASLQGYVDEMIVVDTGSSDRTMDIARQFGATVHNFPWCDDFAAARNESLRHATMDWVLVMDADEEMEPESAPRLRPTIANAESLGLKTVVVFLRDLDAAGNVGSVFRQFKLWKREPIVQYNGRIHEHASVVHPAHDEGLQANHYGYAACRPELRRKKLARNIRLLERDLEHTPNDIHTLHHLAKEYYQAGDYSRAIELVEAEEDEYARKGGTPPAEVFRLKAMATCNNGDHIRALEIAGPAITRFPDHIDLYFVQAEALRKLERWDEVVDCLTRFLRLVRRFRRGEILADEPTVLTAGRSGEAALLLAWAQIKTGNMGGFRRRLVQAYREGKQTDAVDLLGNIISHVAAEDAAAILNEMQAAGPSEALENFTRTHGSNNAD